MYYKSTRDSSVRVESAVAISQGISADGGLFVPESVPKCMECLIKKKTLKPEIFQKILKKFNKLKVECFDHFYLEI